MPEKVWESAQQHLRSILSAEIYNLWFAGIRAKSLDGDCLTLEVANDFCEVWLEKNYLDLIHEKLLAAVGRPLHVKFQISPTPNTIALPHEADKPKTKTELEVTERVNTHRETLFNPKYTFDTFVVGSNNHFAHGAALAVAQNPGKSYNPLFLYGGVGLGKTHLLQAIGQFVGNQKRTAKVT